MFFLNRSLFTARAFGTAIIALSLCGCGDITGESPKIASKDKPETPAPSPAAAASPSPSVSPSPDSGWNHVAERAFGLPVVEQSSATVQAALHTTGPDTISGAAAPSVEPALTSPDPALAESPGLYMRQAQGAKVNWRVWSSETFKEASARQVPLIIVIGTPWSHDASVMDEQVFSDDAIAKALNNNFVPVRVDADERPDVWSRYRLAYEVINKERARPPMIVFALPDGRPFDVVSAVSAHSSGDVLGLQELLTQAQTLMKDQASEVTEQAASIETVLGQLLTAPRAEDVSLSKDVLTNMASELASAASGKDAEALRAGRVAGFLLHYAAQNSGAKAGSAASELLLSRFRSGQRDHVMGGYFFRIPGSGEVQFGKVLPVQAEMITANARAYGLTQKGLHKEGVTEVIRFCNDWLEAPEGGFFTCQASEVAGDPSGAYFTWSQEEIAELAGDGKAAKVFSTYLNAKAGQKSNLNVTGKLQSAADAAGVSYEEALNALDTVRLKLNDSRMSAEKVPMVDKSILAGWNGDMICAYLEAADLIGDDKAKAFALKSADMIIESMVSEKDGVARVLYKGRASGFGYLEDNVKVAAALYQCYRATDQKEYLDSARSLMDFVETRFLDKASGLYLDVADNDATASLGLLKLKQLPLEDDITRAPNAVAALLWYELSDAVKEPKYKERGDRLVNAALQRRPFTTEAVATWGEAALRGMNGAPAYTK